MRSSRAGTRKIGEAERQLGDYWRDDTRHGVVIVFGSLRDAPTWKAQYRDTYLSSGADHEELPAGPDLAGRWRVVHPEPAGGARRVDHFLVQLLKRS